MGVCFLPIPLLSAYMCTERLTSYPATGPQTHARPLAAPDSAYARLLPAVADIHSIDILHVKATLSPRNLPLRQVQLDADLSSVPLTWTAL